MAVLDPIAMSAQKPRMALPLAWSIAVLLGTALVAVTIFVNGLSAAPPDGDDSLRLAQVRHLIATGMWFDRTLPMIGDGAGLASHWSRLIDAPLAAIMLTMTAAGLPALAETVAMMVWPPLVLVAFLGVALSRLLREAGAPAALIFAGFCLATPSTFAQFVPGRIDHHNVQIACAVLAVLIATAPDGSRRLRFVAGVLAGGGLAVGYEALPLIAVLAATLVLRAALDRTYADDATAFAAGLAGAVAFALGLTIPPSEWLQPACDALGSNLVLAAITGAIALAAAARLAPARGARRVAAYGLAAAPVVVAFAIARPLCLEGPFAPFDPAVKPLLIDRVGETASILDHWRQTPALMLGLFGAPIALLILSAARVLETRDGGHLARLGLASVTLLLAAYQSKFLPYAQFVVFALAALALATWRGRLLSLSPGPAALAIIMLVNPPVIAALAGTVAKSRDVQKFSAPSAACRDANAIAGLSGLPAGRLLASPDLGADLALANHHRVLIGNYHRLDRELVRADRVLGTPVNEAVDALRDWRVDYVVTCPGSSFFATFEVPASFAGALAAGRVPAFLEPLELPSVAPLVVYRVRPAS